MIFIPLYSFHSNIRVFEMTDYITLKKIKDYKKIVSIMDKNFFSKEEIESISQCTYLLEISDLYREFVTLPNPLSKIEDMFLLACWIQKSFRLYIRLVFGNEISTISSNLSSPYSSRILHRKRRNKYEDSKIKMELEDLTKIKMNFNKLITVQNNSSRLQLAATFTFWGMVSMTWIEAFITFTNTFEILLTHKRNLGIKRKLALTCACILETSDIKRNIILEEFCSLYKFRCDIVHGKTEAILEDIGYKYLSRISNLLRLTFRKILENDLLIIKLNGSDSERKQLIKNIQGDYIPDFSFLDS